MSNSSKEDECGVWLSVELGKPTYDPCVNEPDVYIEK